MSSLVTLLAITLLSLLPAERRTLHLLPGSFAVATDEREAAIDDRTHAVPAHPVAYLQEVQLFAAGAGTRGGGAGASGAVWTARAPASELPSFVAKIFLSIRDAVDAVRAGSLVRASDHRLESDAHLADAVATVVQFLC